VFWRATDTVLDRPVAVHVATGLTKDQAGALAEAAGRAGVVPDARWVRVLDVGSERSGKAYQVWIISEWVEGTTLAQAVQREPMRGPAAASLILACAQAVSAARQAGASHGALHPGEVVISADGHPRITGLEIHRALHQLTGPPAPAEWPDSRALGGLLFTAVTGRWPLAGWIGLPSPRRGDGRHPRQQRWSVPRELDLITATALDDGYPDPESLVRALAALPVPAPVGDTDDAEHPRRDLVRRVAWWVVPPALIAGIGIAAWTVGSNLGKVPGEDRTNPVATAPHPAKASKLGTHRVWSTPPKVSSFDPDGDGTEDPGGVGLAVDADPSTSWSTDIYHANPHFGGLKPGVGLLLDLGKSKRVDTAKLQLSAPGANLELRAGDTPPRSADDLSLVAAATDAKTNTKLTLSTPTTARYWLLWITALPPSRSNDYTLSVAEIALLR
jgi:hypothetical protein